MFKVSDIITTPPAAFSSELQRRVYETFAEKGIPFERVDTDPGITMEDCQHIDAKIGVRIVKTIFSVQPAQVSVTSTCRGTFLALFVPWQMLQHALGYVLGPFRGPGDAGEDTTTAFGSQSLWSLGIER